MSLAENFRAAGVAVARQVDAPGPRAVFVGLTLVLTALITAAFAGSVVHWTLAALMAVPLVVVNAAWVSGGAATALVGLGQGAQPLGSVTPPRGWVPSGRTAILVTLCKEDPEPVAHYLRDLHKALTSLGLDDRTVIFALSDTWGDTAVAREEGALRDLVDAGRVQYRRRDANTGRKPGNIADWLDRHGDSFDYMMTLDADSRMSANRIRRMIRQIETRPRTGLIQAGMGLVPGQSRFGRHQRTAVRLMSSNFGRGMAAWAGRSGNYWGHNAIMRIAAFREAAVLPRLAGRPPFGGPLLSHDFIEAAWIRRAGWAVELDPDLAGSAEDAPQTLEAFHKRDRRWCQGNLQHLFVLATPGLHPISRFHLISGVVSYLAAPIWLLLVILIAVGSIPVTGALPFVLIAAVLLVPKVCALAERLPRNRTLRRRLVTLRAWIGELAVSTVVAPLMMVRQTGSVLSLLAGRDCGWKSANPPRWTPPRGVPEALAGVAILMLSSVYGGGATLWLAPLIAPLLVAPVLVRALDAQPA
ncbi:glucans biosynthesis glucosyltransferase MdoH [Lacimonas salitolerans]|uniref:Glucans biosynthesis glucosyltransferase H n=1 Tax=Lacimonas salitolerans TaxID=1323750 RepID=A0ABW4EFZ7_9RHOB